jgi:stage II sporulation protein D
MPLMARYPDARLLARLALWLWRGAACLLLPLALLAVGCSTTLNRNPAALNSPVIRVRLLQGLDQVALIAATPPVYRTDANPTPKTLPLPKNTPVVLTLRNHAWQLNGQPLGEGTLTIQPAVEGSVAVAPIVATPGVSTQPRAYRGHYVLVPADNGNKFDVINHVDIDGYLAGVLPREMLHGWHVETYKAQAIAARTYALYEKATHDPSTHYFDVYADERSQVYGGLNDETDKSREAVNDTMGIVVTYSASGKDPRIFKAYFSSCCGGVSQSVADAFGEPAIEPLREQNNHAICNASPYFTWGPVVISKRELTRRIRAWGKYKDNPAKNLDLIADAAVLETNPWKRPTKFLVTDAKGVRYTLMAEQFRQACNWDAQNPAYKDKSVAKAPTLLSSFVNVITDHDNVRFVEGHGFGHGVGLCQWCSERRAEEGMRCEDIVLTAYPHAKLMRAY